MTKDVINLVIAGHVDHGKSTLVGRIFLDSGLISERMLARMKRHAEAVGKRTFYLAFLTDEGLEERQRGLSIETSFKGFETERRRYNIIDAPGHRDFVKNMISGASEADVAVLVVDVGVSANAGLAPQTREHLILLQAMGIERLVVALNKMDAVHYDSEMFELARLEVSDFCEQLGYSAGVQADFVPVSALNGDNVSICSAKTPYYEGPPLLDLLDGIPPIPRPIELPLRMPILRTFAVPGVGSVVAGKIETGQVAPGDSVVIAPYPGTGLTRAEVKSIEWQHQSVDAAQAGDDVGVLLTKQEKGFVSRQVKKGAVMGSPGASPRAVSRFKAQILVVDHPNGFGERYAPYLHVHQAAMPCSIEQILSASNIEGTPMTPEEASDGRIRLVNGCSAVVWVRSQKPLVIEPASRFPRLGRFVLRDGRTVATGLCLEVEGASAIR